MRRRSLAAALAATSLLSIAAAQDRGLAVEARRLAGSESFDIGRQYAVVIGIDAYENWPALGAAREEARRVREVLGRDYYIDEFIELYDGEASARSLRKLFAEDLPAKVGKSDSLLVFYAGHGQVDAAGAGYWIPSDAGLDPLEQKGWLSNAQIRGYIQKLKAQRILLVADSCFAGELLDSSRGALPELDSAYYRKALSLTARQVLTSGASEAVPDQSEFGRQFIDCLERNVDPYIDALAIYDRVRRGVTKTLPLYGSLPGNELGASFVLFRRARADRGVVAVSSPVKVRDWISPDSAPGTRIEGQGRFELEPGDYEYFACLPDDEEATYSKRLRVEGGGMISIALPELGYSKPFQVNRLKSRRSELAGRYATQEQARLRKRGIGFASLAAAAVSAGVAAFGYYDQLAAYDRYWAANTPEEAVRERERTMLGSYLYGGGFIGAGLFCAISLPFLGADPAKKTRAEMAQIDARIEELSR